MKKNNVIDVHSEKFINIMLCIAPLVFMILFHLLRINDEANVKFFMPLALAVVTAYGGYLAYKDKLDAAKAVTLLMTAGVIMRTGYTIYTHAFTRGMDIGMNNPDGVGHWGYLYRVLNGTLPESNEYQFYQPPLFYIISVIFIKAAMFVTGGDDLNGYMYMSQLVSCIASCVALVTFSEIMDELKIKKSIQIIPVALIAFYPIHILAAGRMNNDALVFMFMVLALYFTLKWHKEQKLGFIIGIALSIGCGMMTKINGALIAFVSGPIMIYHFVKRIKSKDGTQIKDIIIQLAVFAVIVFPLGLWYPIRNYILFDQPLNFVHDLGKNHLLYTGDRSFVERWIHVPFLNYAEKPYMDMPEDASIWMASIKTGIHGEFEWENLASVLAWGSDYVHALMLILCVVSFVFTAITDKDITNTQKYAPLWVWLLTFVSYIQFNVAYPYSCTPDFRYMLLWQLAAAIFVGYFVDYCFRNREKRTYKILFNTEMVIIFLFCTVSIIKLL